MSSNGQVNGGMWILFILKLELRIESMKTGLVRLQSMECLETSVTVLVIPLRVLNFVMVITGYLWSMKIFFKTNLMKACSVRSHALRMLL
jgi:hypothetical protein